MQLRSDQIAALIDMAEHTTDEVCGVLIGQAGQAAQITSIVPARNVHPQPARHFLIDAATLLAADQIARAADQTIIGFYHSHPRSAAVPSAADRAAAWPDHLYLVIGRSNAHAYLCAWRVAAKGVLQPEALVIEPAR